MPSTGSSTATPTWGVCRYCATAVAPGRDTCELCGADRPVPAGQLASAPRSVRRRVTFFNWLRMAVMVGVCVALAWALLDAAFTGQPSVPDPLTTTGTYTVAPGTYAFLAGNVTGGDYIAGNFTTVVPYGANVSVSVYNSTTWTSVLVNGTGSPLWSSPSAGSGRIVFSALVTGNYTFVLTNPYPASSHFDLTVYVATKYYSNVGDDGMG